jgi:glycine/D-amino acid oxidase-like deaminating enzyme
MRRPTHPWGTPPWSIDFRPAKHALSGHVDFAIVGAGFAGLSAAACLAKLAPRKSVLVLESESIGNGASGRTGGVALDQTAAGPLPSLGNVLAGYRKILRALKIDADLTLPGVWELARTSALKNSPISWDDSGDLRAARKVPGGTLDPGKVVSGLARAAEKAGVQILENAEVLEITPGKTPPQNSDSSPVSLRVRLRSGRGTHQRSITAEYVLVTTNAASLGFSGLTSLAEPKLTLALATAPLTHAQLRAIGLASHRPFYTIDFPYLWGRLLENNGVIFGSGLVPLPSSARSPFTSRRITHRTTLSFRDLLRFDVRKGITAQRLAWLESRVRNLHPALKHVRVTHRWGGPILLTKDFRPAFRYHPRSKRILILGGFSGHGVALAVYLGRHAAASLAGLRPLPRWASSR